MSEKYYTVLNNYYYLKFRKSNKEHILTVLKDWYDCWKNSINKSVNYYKYFDDLQSYCHILDMIDLHGNIDDMSDLEYPLEWRAIWWGWKNHCDYFAWYETPYIITQTTDKNKWYEEIFNVLYKNKISLFDYYNDIWIYENILMDTYKYMNNYSCWKDIKDLITNKFWEYNYENFIKSRYVEITCKLTFISNNYVSKGYSSDFWLFEYLLYENDNYTYSIETIETCNKLFPKEIINIYTTNKTEICDFFSLNIIYDDVLLIAWNEYLDIFKLWFLFWQILNSNVSEYLLWNSAIYIIQKIVDHFLSDKTETLNIFDSFWVEVPDYSKRVLWIYLSYLFFENINDIKWTSVNFYQIKKLLFPQSFTNKEIRSYHWDRLANYIYWLDHFNKYIENFEYLSVITYDDRYLNKTVMRNISFDHYLGNIIDKHSLNIDLWKLLSVQYKYDLYKDSNIIYDYLLDNWIIYEDHNYIVFESSNLIDIAWVGFIPKTSCQNILMDTWFNNRIFWLIQNPCTKVIFYMKKPNKYSYFDISNYTFVLENGDIINEVYKYIYWRNVLVAGKYNTMYFQPTYWNDFWLYNTVKDLINTKYNGEIYSAIYDEYKDIYKFYEE